MTEDKKLKLSYGDFTCEIAGYDDPFTILNKVFGLMATYTETAPELMGRLSDESVDGRVWRGALAADLASKAARLDMDVEPRENSIAIAPRTVADEPAAPEETPAAASAPIKAEDRAAPKADSEIAAPDETSEAPARTDDAPIEVAEAEAPADEAAEADQKKDAKKPADPEDVIAAFRAANAATAVKAAAVRAASVLSRGGRAAPEAEDAVTVSDDGAEPSTADAKDDEAAAKKPNDGVRVVEDVEILPPPKGADEPKAATTGAPDVGAEADDPAAMPQDAGRRESRFKEKLRERDLADTADAQADEPKDARDVTPDVSAKLDETKDAPPPVLDAPLNASSSSAPSASAPALETSDEPAASSNNASDPPKDVATEAKAEETKAADAVEDAAKPSTTSSDDAKASETPEDDASAAEKPDDGPKLGAEAPMTTSLGAAPPVRRRRRFIVDKQRSKPHERPAPSAPGRLSAVSDATPPKPEGGLQVTADNFLFDGASETSAEEAEKLAEAEARFKGRYAKPEAADPGSAAPATEVAAPEPVVVETGKGDEAAPSPEALTADGSAQTEPDRDEAAPKAKRRGLRLFGSSDEDPANAEEAAPASASEDPGIDRLREVASAELPRFDGGGGRKPGEAPAAPIFALSDADDFSDDASPGAFARQMGAASLQDALEASAAYIAIVGGKAKFSRGDVMQAFSEIGFETRYTKEAQLKTFRKLLANRAIVRTEDGNFQLSHSTRFGYETRIRAGAA